MLLSAVTLDLPPGFVSEYKLVHIIPGRSPVWEFIDNRTLTIPTTAGEETITLQWCAPPVGRIAVSGTDSMIDTVPSAISVLETPSAGLMEEAVTPEANTVITDAVTLEVLAPEIKEPNGQKDDPLGVLDEETLLTAEQTEKVAAQKESGESMLTAAAKTAGAVALGVAGAALLSALAIDVADTAIMGAVAVAAGSAALSGSNGSKRSKSADTGADEEIAGGGEPVEEGERRITGAGEAGVIIAAGLMSAYDAGKSIVTALDGQKQSEVADQAANEE